MPIYFTSKFGHEIQCLSSLNWGHIVVQASVLHSEVTILVLQRFTKFYPKREKLRTLYFQCVFLSKIKKAQHFWREKNIFKVVLLNEKGVIKLERYESRNICNITTKNLC